MRKSDDLPVLISIKSMKKYFNCSRTTLYNRYISKLERQPTKGNKVMFLFEDVKKLKQQESEQEYVEVDIDSVQ